jgi:hypothetical protein
VLGGVHAVVGVVEGRGCHGGGGGGPSTPKGRELCNEGEGGEAACLGHAPDDNCACCVTSDVLFLVLCAMCLSCPQVVDALSRHFLAFACDSRSMPVIWHISLLTFVQRYKHQLTTADRDALTHLTTGQHHYKVGRGGLCLCLWVGGLSVGGGFVCGWG